MRLDSFLSSVGIVKRRTEAARLLREGRVLVDGRAAKPASEARPGQRIRVDGPRGVTCWTVLDVPTGNVRRADYGKYAGRVDDAGEDPA
jgi:ribosomal 50S subunit-recycling heat shock protein